MVKCDKCGREYATGVFTIHFDPPHRSARADIWAQKPKPVEADVPYLHGVPSGMIYHKQDMDTWLDNLRAKITQLNECLGEYDSHEWCGHCIADSKCAQITLHVIELKGLIKKNDDVMKAVQALTERVNEIEQEYVQKTEAIEALVANSGLVVRSDKLKEILETEE